ncbi:LysR family transcriptional regulator [Pelagimonas varians]|uniref:HTH-type transcriptional regulator CynR n=1 Tax=Pelagimonas varians TaxID=696760 RepID=A0A238L6G3_9RHOB|nr:LysR family transcriptional regulator [Pelagimonas varians]PYG25043.1 DNA-binding transcriptional LysR family regulator [Pelagimonas varians]SMX50589.1 HTH-type transcriptional regulator CynR [Pelagimonas varians]
MSIRLEMLRAFSVTAGQGTLAGAAAVLGRTPSAVSMMLAQFEQEVGGPLFETDRKNRLTPLGQLVLEESLRATDVFDKSVGAIRRHVLTSAGIVRIAAVPSATVTLLPDVIEVFRRAHPDVRIEISDVDSATVRARIQRDEADIGILSAQPGDPLEGERILSDDLGIVCAEGGPIHKAHLATDGASDWGLLRLEPLIANPLCELVDDPHVDQMRLASTLEARNTTAILSFVRRGFGVSILPFDAVRNQPDGVEFFVPTQSVSQRELRKIKQEKELLRGPVFDFWSLLNE